MVPDVNIPIIETDKHPWLSGMKIRTLHSVWAGG